MWVEEMVHPGEGDEELSVEHNNDPHAGGDRDKPRSRRGRNPRGGPSSKAGDVGRALRSVYDSTLREDVPRDFLDLLGKLN
jgi:hypothetical protein